MIKIGMVMKALEANFFQEMKKGAEKWAEQNKEVELIIEGTISQTDILGQIDLVKDLIAKKVDILIVIPIDSKALTPISIQAVEADIVVVNIDIKLDGALLKEAEVVIPFVGPDNREASREVGTVLADKIGRNKNVVLIEGLPSSDNSQQRVLGFLDVIDSYEMNLITSLPADWETHKAEEIMIDILSRHSDIDGIFCCNDAMALGVSKVLVNNGLTIPIVGFDNDYSIQPLLKSGKLLATIDAFGSRMAVEGIECALKIRKGESTMLNFKAPYTLIRPIN